jgi:prolyl oligopeptidase
MVLSWSREQGNRPGSGKALENRLTGGSDRSHVAARRSIVKRRSAILAVLMAASCLAAAGGDAADPFLWLEEVEGEKALTWVKEQSRLTTSELERVPEFKPILQQTLEILDSEARIPTPAMRGGFVYNYWQDKAHPRGIWRRTTPESFRTEAPEWETMLDLDALGEEDGVPWAWGGASCLAPDQHHCMIALSRGGSDAVVYREYDTRTRAFVTEGFTLPEAKSSIDWYDENTLWVGTDFGAGSLTSSGYPRLAKLWKRGTSLSSARTVFEGQPEDVWVAGSTRTTPDGRYHLVSRTPAFFRHETFLLLDDRLVKLDLPEDSSLDGFFKDHLLVTLRSDWEIGGTKYSQGSLLATRLDPFLRGERSFDILFEPTERASLVRATTSRSHVLLSVLDNVRGKLFAVSPESGTWKRTELTLPGFGQVKVEARNPFSDAFFYSYSGFLTPASLYLAHGGKAEKVKTAPEFFPAEGMSVTQHETTSRDGTKIPYFLVTPAGFEADGAAPVLLYGYGGFEISQLPRYSGVLGKAWLERGGVYAVANTRGGGEFGPGWHQAALKQNRIKSFEDFIAVADNLVARKIASPRHLGIMGGSQGGLLVGGAFALRPDLFQAVVSQVPLADMRRYHKLLAGASWMSEYGDPDVPEEWAYIQTWSPYHLLRKDAGYPRVFFWTTFRDDRVHPAHARKMAAKMLDLGYPVYYYENTEGGHGSGSVNRQRAYTRALEYAYLWKMLR